MKTFSREEDFELALCELLAQKGWDSEVLLYPSEEDLLRNWADILFTNNKQIDRLNDCPLTDGEMAQLLEQIREKRTPHKLNGFINGKTVSIRRDNPEDRLHFGKEISLKIFDRQEIALGSSRYQIARQPLFRRGADGQRDRRGDLMLLINGMPIFHIELKRSGVHVSQAYNQIEKYSREGVFSGIFALVQIFVAMNPEETVYFANPGPDGKFNPQYYFHWADAYNEPVNEWEQVTEKLLSIPMAHQMLGFYTVADDSDGVLKVMRSYQYYAAHAISDKVDTHKGHWNEGIQRGGYIWHTTGSGKTMTSFKAAHLISTSRAADKVVFLTDRIELGTQSLDEYNSFADDSLEVQGTENTHILIDKLKSSRPDDVLIVTSIQKMFRVKADGAGAADIEKIARKKIVIVVDEAHRSTFGDMLNDIKQTLPNALFFGFTGTPIQLENQRKESTTCDIFGEELHRYSISDGIRDRNVLGFDVHKVCTYKDLDLRRCVALEKAKAQSEAEALADEAKRRIYLHYMEDVPMAGGPAPDGSWVSGIEDYLPSTQYRTEEHQMAVVQHIADNWLRLSRGGKFHAIFATSSIAEAIEYYSLFREQVPGLKVTALYEPGVDDKNAEYSLFKEESTSRIVRDYNEQYGTSYELSSYGAFKKDLSHRLAHKKAYSHIEKSPEKCLDLLIVVDQMLTGFDSKWVNTLYLDKLMEYEKIIQAFSRTNRLFGPDKPFGNIYYYRQPHTMEQNIAEAVALYSGNRAYGMFVDKLVQHLRQMNASFERICEVFASERIENFSKLPEDVAAKGMFAKEFRILTEKLEAAKIQGFVWSVLHYENELGESVDVALDEQTYLTLAQRYKELDKVKREGNEVIPYPIEHYLTQIDTGRIDAEYLNSRFQKYIKAIRDDSISAEEKAQLYNDLHRAFAALSQEEQKFAEIFLRDIDRGAVELQEGKNFRDYVTEYIVQARNDSIHRLAQALGVDEIRLRKLIDACPTEKNLNEHERFDELCRTVDVGLAQSYFEQGSGRPMRPFEARRQAKALLRLFVLSGGQDGASLHSEPSVYAEIVSTYPMAGTSTELE